MKCCRRLQKWMAQRSYKRWRRNRTLMILSRRGSIYKNYLKLLDPSLRNRLMKNIKKTRLNRKNCSF